METSKYPDVAGTIKLLIAKGANVNAMDEVHHTALIFAAYNGRMHNANILLAAGADPNIITTDTGLNGEPFDALEAAKAWHHDEIATLISEAQKQSKTSRTKP